jgi:soluble lytic murein transglycosylase-like protein
MNEEAFIRSISLKKIGLIFNIVFIFTFFAFSSSGEKNPRPLPQYEEVAEEPTVDIQISAASVKKSRLYHSIILTAANRYLVDPALVKAIIMAESGYDPQAVSSQGATGLMQLMPGTAEALGVEDAFNPEHNVNGGVRYLKHLLEEFNHDIKLALAAYNAGSSTVKRHQGIPPIKATQDYIKKVFTYYRYYKNEAIGETDSA